MADQCCCGRIKPCTETSIINQTQHEPLGDDGAFCGPVIKHDLRDAYRKVDALKVERDAACRERDDVTAKLAICIQTIQEIDTYTHVEPFDEQKLPNRARAMMDVVKMAKAETKAEDILSKYAVGGIRFNEANDILQIASSARREAVSRLNAMQGDG